MSVITVYGCPLFCLLSELACWLWTLTVGSNSRYGHVNCITVSRHNMAHHGRRQEAPDGGKEVRGLHQKEEIHQVTWCKKTLWLQSDTISVCEGDIKLKLWHRVWGNAAKSSPTSTVRDISAPWSTVKNRKETRARHLWSAVLYCSWSQSLSAILWCSFSGANLSTLAGLSLCCTA